MIRNSLYLKLTEFRRLLKAKVAPTSFGYSLMRSCYRLLIPTVQEFGAVRQTLESFANKQQNIAFVQIGSCDGLTGDPINELVRKHSWSGLLVEPVPSMFELLKRNYSDVSGLKFANVAISETDEKREFWYVKPGNPSAPEWAKALGSFYPEVILGHKCQIPDLEDYVESTSIECLSLKSLFDRFDVRRVDLLHIDTEGNDFRILSQFDFTKYSPKIILYEDKHLDVAESRSSRGFLKSKGYRIIAEDGDIIALLE